jgi:phosphoribosylformimino-5-aminoimidazole carboxamide ribotide isomerase
VAVLIPSIDLMGGKIVQLVGGSRKALEFDNFDDWVQRFSSYPLVQLIDLDAAMGRGNNRALLQRFVQQLPCQVGGGIRSLEAATEVLAIGARRVILGSALISNGAINTRFAEELASGVGAKCLVFAVDAKAGRVVIRGWQEPTNFSPYQMMKTLEPWCDAFLYTHVDTEGQMIGFPFEIAQTLRRTTARKIIVAGGITTAEEVDRLDQLGLDAVVGMAIYLGKIRA